MSPGRRCGRPGSIPGAGQRVPSALPHIRQVHGVDPVGHLAHAAQVLPFDAGGAGARLDLPGFVDRADGQAAAPACLRAASSSPATANRRTTPIAARGRRLPGRAAAASGPACGPPNARRSSTRSVCSGRTSPRRRTCPPAATALSARSRAAAVPAAQRVSGAPAQRLSWRQQPPSVLVSSQTHDRQAAAFAKRFGCGFLEGSG